VTETRGGSKNGTKRRQKNAKVLRKATTPVRGCKETQAAPGRVEKSTKKRERGKQRGAGVPAGQHSCSDRTGTSKSGRTHGNKVRRGGTKQEKKKEKSTVKRTRSSVGGHRGRTGGEANGLLGKTCQVGGRGVKPGLGNTHKVGGRRALLGAHAGGIVSDAAPAREHTQEAGGSLVVLVSTEK